MPKKMGRPTLWRPEMAEKVTKLCILGVNDEQLAASLGVSSHTFDRWRKSQPEFVSALKAGRQDADNRVARSLWDRANGYSHEAVKIFNNNGVPLIVPYTEHFPPDPTSMIFWLKNRRPDLWRDQQNTLNFTNITNNVLPDEVVRKCREIVKADNADARRQTGKEA